MASKVSSTSSLPWIWAIESLACSSKVDTSLLIDMVKSSPEISDDLEKNVREMVTLRILEGLSEENQIENIAPAQGQNSDSDPSKGAKDVIQRILDEMSATDPELVGQEVLNWDIQSFIMHKRSSFPTRALQKLKEAILEGGHSVLASLKERSGLTVITQCDNNTSENIGNFGCRTERPGKDSREISENGDEESEDMPDRNLVPASTSTAATSGENLGKIRTDDGSTEKFKQDSNITTDSIVQDSVGSPSHGQSTNASKEIVPCIGRDRSHLPDEVKVRSSPHQNQDNRLDENLEGANLLPAKENRVVAAAAAAADNLDRPTSEGHNTSDNSYHSHAEASKKIKQWADFIRNRGENQITSPLYGQSTNASDEILNCTEREAHNLQLDVKVGSSTPQNRDGELQGTAPDRNLLPSKRNRVIVTAGEQSGDCFDSHAEVTKKFRNDMNVTGDNLVENPISSPIHGIMTTSSDVIIKDIHTGKCNLEKDAPPGAVECDPHDSERQNAAMKRLSQRSDADDQLSSPLVVEANHSKVAEPSASLNGQKKVVDGENVHGGYEPIKFNSSSSVGLEKEILPENATYGFQGKFPANASNGGEAKEDRVCSSDLEMTSDGDEHDRVDAALKKYSLLCSHHTQSQDSFATQSNSCIKCGGDGELLICSSNTCQLVVHKNCLRSAGTFDENGKFFCPFCSYSRTLSEYFKLKKKASLARKDLAMFIGVKTDGQPKKSTSASDGAKQGQLERHEFGIDDEGNVDEVLMNKASMYHPPDNMENWKQAEPPESHSGDSPLHDKRMGLTDGTDHGSAKSNMERLDKGQHLQRPVGNLEQLKASELVKKSDNVCRNSKVIDRNEKIREMRGKKIQDIPKSTLPLEPLRGSSVGSSEEENEKFATSRYSKRLRNPVNHYSYPAIPQLRRKPVPWSPAEEEKLKEGVKRLTRINDRKISWAKILEFGAVTFHKGRSAADLKDKWRNMCKGSPTLQ